MPVATLTVKVIFSSLKISQIIPIVIIHEVKYVAARIRTIPRKKTKCLKEIFPCVQFITSISNDNTLYFINTFTLKFSFYVTPPTHRLYII